MPQILRGRRYGGGVREVFGRYRPYGQVLQLSPGEPVPPQAQVVQPAALEQGEEARGPAVGVGDLGRGRAPPAHSTTATSLPPISAEASLIGPSW
jgi:hypothetical protein